MALSLLLEISPISFFVSASVRNFIVSALVARLDFIKKIIRQNK
jgi:hypothetical protein